MAETIALDPATVAVNRSQLDITAWVDADPGVDWGDAAIQAYMADQQIGSSPVDYRLPNRQIKIPLNLRAVGGTSYSSIRLSLQQKAAIFQAEGGILMRQIDSTPLYADVVDATLHLGGSILAAYRSIDVDAVLSLECLPDWYGTELTLPALTVKNGVLAAVVTATKNVVPNPSFEYDATGGSPAAWTPAALSGFTNTGASLLIVTTQHFVGNKALQVTTTNASTQQGPSVQLVGAFTAGVQYTFSVALRGNAGGEQVSVIVGNGADVAASGTATLTTSWAISFVRWTPASNQSTAFVAVRSASAAAYTFFVDAAIVAQGSGIGALGLFDYFDGDEPPNVWDGTAGNSSSGPPQTIPGNYPGRVRLSLTDLSGSNQNGLLWGWRARNYSSATTARVFYEAETMTPVNGAAGTAVPGASGGTAVQVNVTAPGNWMSILNTTLTAGSATLTHQGSYRVWMRAYAPIVKSSFRLLWGAGGLAVPNTNDAVQLPLAGTFCLVDLGQIRVDAPPVGGNFWQGAIQVNSPGTADISNIDTLYFQPLDETAGKLAYTAIAPASSIATTLTAGSAVDDSTTGTLAWTDGSGGGALLAAVTAQENSSGALTYARAKASASPVTSHYLRLTAFGFTIPAGATIQGIQANVWRTALNNVSNWTRDNAVRLVKALTIQATDRSIVGNWPVGLPYSLATYGGPTDLWGGAWTPSDINNSGFGFAISVNDAVQGEGRIDYVVMIVYYTLASGFTVAQDAVVYASRFAEVRTEGAYRSDSAGIQYSPVSSVIGDLPRIPVSRLEARTIELFVKPTRGNFGQLGDTSLDDMSVQIIYRPSFLFVGA